MCSPRSRLNGAQSKKLLHFRRMPSKNHPGRDIVITKPTSVLQEEAGVEGLAFLKQSQVINKNTANVQIFILITVDTFQ